MKKALYILAEMSDRDFEWLLSVGRNKRISAGTTLIYEGQPIDALYIVLEGVLTVSVEAMGNEEVARLGMGEVVGEMSFVDSRRPSATVKALEDTLLWSIPRSQLMAKLSHDLSFSSHFYQSVAVFLADRLRSTVKRFGEHQDPQFEEELPDADLNPKLAENLELAKARLNWMLSRLRGL